LSPPRSKLDRLVKGKRPEGRTYNPGIDAVTVLFVCTGNICRSPMAEGLLRARLADRGVSAEVQSAGLTFDDREATREAIAVAARAGIDISNHRSRIVDGALINASALEIGRASCRERV